MARRSIVATVSVFVHAIVLVALATVDLWRPITEWPRPREVMAFTPPAVHVDIELPPESRRTTATPSREPSSTGPVRPNEAAPIAPPPDIAPEGERQQQQARLPFGDSGPLDNSRGGFGDAVAPPPPPVVPTQPVQKTPLRPHSGIKPPQRLVNVAPVYPVVALSARKEGIVIIDATIDEQGNVTETRILRSIPLLDEAAVAAVRQWKFSPTLLNGVPVPIVMTVTVNFKLTP
jgi:TonB family protein